MIKKNRQIKIGAILSYVSIAVNIIAGLLYTPWMVNQIGKSQYGLYTLANSLITLFLVDFGLSSATTRYVSKYNAEGNQEKVNNFLGAVYKLYLIIDTIIFVILFSVFFFIDKIYVNLTPEELSQFKVVYVISAAYAIFHFPFITQNGVLTAYEQFVQLKLADLIYRALLILFTVIALILNLGLYALVAVHAIVGFVIILFKFIVLKARTPIKANFKYVDKSLYIEIFKFSVWVTVAMLAKRLIFNITPTILGITADTNAIAIFGVIVTVEGYFYTLTTAINGMFMPKISKAYVEDEKNAVRNIESLFLNVGRFQYALNGLLVAGFVLIGKTFIELWMGIDYTLAYFGVLLVVVPSLFYNSLQIANTTLTVKNKVNIQAIIGIVSGIINVILSFVFSILWGVIGACLSIFVAYMMRALLMNIVAQKVLKFNIAAFAKTCYLKMSLPIILSISLGAVLNFLLPKTSWGFLVLKGFLIVFIYALFILFVGLNSRERKRIMRIIKNCVRKMYGFVKKLVQIVYKTLLPIRKIILFESVPDLSDNTKAVFDEIVARNLHKEYKLVWCVHKDVATKDKVEGVEYLNLKNKKQALKFFRYTTQAKVLISCNTFLCKCRKGQLAIYLAHGVPIKSTKAYYRVPKSIDYCLTTSEAMIDPIETEYCVEKAKILPLGYPRNDIFSKPPIDLKKLLGLDCKKIVVWYPTFRQHKCGLKQTKKAIPLIENVDIAIKLNDYLKENEIVIYLKPHFAQDVSYVKSLDLSNIIFIDDGFFEKHNITSYEFVGGCDALISDYSSIYYDFSLCDKQIAVVWEDIEEYKLNPGLVPNYEFLLKGAEKVYNLEDLVRFLGHVITNNDVLKVERNEIKNLVNVSTDGKNSARVVDFILSKIK